MPSPHRLPTASRLASAVCLFLLATTTQAQTFTVDDVLETRSVRLADLSDDGRWAAVLTYALEDRLGRDNALYGDPTYVAPFQARLTIVDTRTGESIALFDGPRQVEGVAFAPDGARLALLLRRPDGDRFDAWIVDRDGGHRHRIRLPDGLEVAVNGPLSPAWSRDGATLYLPLRTADWHERARRAFLDQVQGIVVRDSQEPFLAWEAVRRLGSLYLLAAYDVADRRVHTIMDETALLDYEPLPDGRLRYTVDITDKTDYERIFGTDGKVLVRPADGGEPVVVIENTHELGRIRWSRDGTAYTYGKDGDVWFGTVDADEARNLTADEEEATGASPAGETPETDPGRAAPGGTEADTAGARFSPVALSTDGGRIVASSKDGLYLIDTQTGDRHRFIETDPEAEHGPEHDVVGFDAAGEAVWLHRQSRTAWRHDVLRYDIDDRAMRELHTADGVFESLRLADDGSTILYEAAAPNRPGDLWAADGDMDDARRLTRANPQLEDRPLARAELVSYLDVDGKELHGVLYYPVGYEEGTRYPTILYVYERFFDPDFSTTVNLFTAHGYAVMRPTVDFEIGFPGEAWLKGVTAAANELIRRGIADPDRLAVQGTSYGGYAVNLLITQTDRFAAAVNVSGKVNMVSFYTDSPRLATRNIHAPENSQDRIGATLWEQPQKYLAHSAILYADRIDTPLLLITGEEDYNVPADQAMEMYYALRRLGKDVAWVNYMNGGHGTPTATSDEVRDYYRRILEFYDEKARRVKRDR